MTETARKPIEVVLASRDSEIAGDFQNVLPDEFSLVSISNPTELSTKLANNTVSCVILSRELPKSLLNSIVTSIIGHDTKLHVVIIGSGDVPAQCLELTQSHAVHFLQQECSMESVAETVLQAVPFHVELNEYRQGRQILDSLMDQFPYSMYVKDRDAQYVMATDEMPNSGSIQGKTDLEWLEWDPEAAKRAYHQDRNVIETGESIIQREEELNEITGDSSVWTETTKVPWYDDKGDIQGLVGAAIDITQRKQLEEDLQQSQALLSRLARYVAHDIRNPLNVAHGHLELARESPDSESLDAIEAALERIEAIVTDMEIITGNNEAPVDPSSPPISLQSVIRDAWETLEAESADLDIIVPAGFTIHADYSPLQEIFENLLQNAVEHGGPDVRIRAGTLPHGFYIEDNGPGLPEELDSVFQFGASSGESESGIGLAIVQEIVNTYDWSITTGESEWGGARFEITGAHVISQSPPGLDENFTEKPLDASRDIGQATPPGSAQSSSNAGSWQVTGGGADIYHQTNEHHFVYTTITSPAHIMCRLRSLDATHEYGKAGVMIRSGLAERDPFGFIGMTKSNGSEMLWRTDRESPTINDPLDESGALPAWYRLSLHDEFVTAAVSSSGEDWNPIDQYRIPVTDSMVAGIVVCSHDPDVLAEAHFENVTVLS